MPVDHELFTQFLNEVFGQEWTILKHEAEDGAAGVGVCLPTFGGAGYDHGCDVWAVSFQTPG
jgi:hypothetical protein